MATIARRALVAFGLMIMVLQSSTAFATKTTHDASMLDRQLDKAREQIGTGDVAQAVKDLKSMVEVHPTNGDVWVALGVGLHTVGKVQDGLDAYVAAQQILGEQVCNNFYIEYSCVDC
jgi:cytochrome c-type biogenesis protein CcmH/NrfG